MTEWGGVKSKLNLKCEWLLVTGIFITIFKKYNQSDLSMLTISFQFVSKVTPTNSRTGEVFWIFLLSFPYHKSVQSRTIFTKIIIFRKHLLSSKHNILNLLNRSFFRYGRWGPYQTLQAAFMLFHLWSLSFQMLMGVFIGMRFLNMMFLLFQSWNMHV